MRYFLVYQITNKINNMIYIGCHVTHNPKDKYMGSGTNIKKAIKQYGLENFNKSILYCFDNEKDMLDKEAELVNLEFISKTDNYNVIIGGGTFLTLDTIPVKDKNGKYFRIHKTDSRYLSGELVHNSKGTITVKDKDDNFFNVDITDPRYLSGELLAACKNTVYVKDKDNNECRVDINDSRYLSGELQSVVALGRQDKICVKDKNNNYIFINKTDPKFLSGELTHLWAGRKHSDETKNKQSIKAKERIGKLNSSFGSCWITKDEENKKIKNEEINKYLTLGWIKGRKIKSKMV